MLSTCNIKFLCFVFMLMNIGSNAFANNKVGNGGNVVQCKGEKASIQLLDFYEHGVTPEIKKEKAFEIAEEILKRLEKIAPKLGAQYLKRLKQTPDDIDYVENVQIVDVPDSKHLLKPLDSNCQIVQIAVRNNIALDGDKKFLIRKDLWNQLQPVQQAGLLTHEIIHEHFTKLGEETSIKARRINAKLYAKDIKSKEFWKLIQDLELPIYP